MQNPIVVRLTNAITPIVSIGVGSAIWTVCNQNKLNPEALTIEHLPLIKHGLVEHYRKFWAGKIDELSVALNAVR